MNRVMETGEFRCIRFAQHKPSLWRDREIEACPGQSEGRFQRRFGYSPESSRVEQGEIICLSQATTRHALENRSTARSGPGNLLDFILQVFARPANVDQRCVQ